MRITSYLIFNGNCREALDFYQKIFDAPEPEIMRYDQMPPAPDFTLSDEHKNLIMHAELRVGDDFIYFSDNGPGMEYNEQVGDKIFLTLERMDVDSAERVFNRLKEGGAVLMPLGKTFWSPAFGMLIDKFGVKWMVSAQ